MFITSGECRFFLGGEGLWESELGESSVNKFFRRGVVDGSLSSGLDNVGRSSKNSWHPSIQQEAQPETWAVPLVV